MQQTVRFALVGPGRAGTAMTEALARSGWTLVRVAGRAPESPSVQDAAARFGAEAAPVPGVGRGVDLLVLAVPDAVISEVASAAARSLAADTLVVHLSGALGLEAFDWLRSLRPDIRVGAVHPLQTIAGTVDDADRLRGTWFAVESDARAGHPDAADVVEAAGGRAFTIADRRIYHAAAVVASNHLVSLLGQLERLAAMAGAPREAFEPLARTALANAFAMGAERALTGPVARGDVATVTGHLDALPSDERATYLALAREALRLAGRSGREWRLALGLEDAPVASNEGSPA